jgi:hypothetical protein
MVWPYFIANALANVLWLIAFQNEYLLVSVGLMAVIVVTLAIIMKLFYRLRRAMSTTHRYFFQVPFSLYFGWVSIASIVNVASWLQSLDIPFLMDNEVIFGVAAISVGALLSLYLLIYKKDYIYTFAVVWAFVGIWIGNMQQLAIVNTAKFAAITLLAACAIQFIADRIKVARYGKVTV